MADELSHYGVKGMRWGVRKDRSAGRSSSDSVKDRRGNTIRKTNRGNYRNSKDDEISKDAVKTRVNQTKAKQKGTDTLSTKELQELVNRLDLEKRYDKIASGNKETSRGQAMVKKLMQKDTRKKIVRAGKVIAPAATMVYGAYQVGKDIERVKL